MLKLEKTFYISQVISLLIFIGLKVCIAKPSPLVKAIEKLFIITDVSEIDRATSKILILLTSFKHLTNYKLKSFIKSLSLLLEKKNTNKLCKLVRNIDSK